MDTKKGRASQVAQTGKKSSCNMEDLGLIPGLGRSPGEGNDYPLQYSCLENPHRHRSLLAYSSWVHIVSLGQKGDEATQS